MYDCWISLSFLFLTQVEHMIQRSFTFEVCEDRAIFRDPAFEQKKRQAIHRKGQAGKGRHVLMLPLLANKREPLPSNVPVAHGRG